MIHANICSEVLDCCDLPIKSIVGNEEVSADIKEIQLGSYTCGNYFVYILNHLSCCIEKLPRNVRINLVIPVLAEDQLDTVIKSLSNRKIATSDISKVIVNDYGGIELSKKYFFASKVGLGRILFRQYRDFRYPEYAESVLTIHTSEIEMISRTVLPKSIDIDCIGYNIDLSNISTDMEVYLHHPFVLSTYGHICEFASVSKEISQKFRPDDVCNHECFSCKIRYSNDDKEYFKMGRGIYYPISCKQDIQITGHSIKIIKKPRWECYENISSAQRI